MLIERRDNAVDHCCEYTEQGAALDAQIAAFPVTAAEVEAKEAARLAAEQAEAAERLRQLTEETDNQLIEIYDNAVVEVSAPYHRHGGGWATCSPGETIRLPRHRVAAHERDMAEAVAWIGRQEDERLERARREEERFDRNRKLDQRDDEPTAAEIMAAAKAYNVAHGGV